MFKLIVLLSIFKFINAIIPGNIKDEGPLVGQYKSVLDANWRWIHYNGNYQNCFDGSWNCGDNCDSCVLEGVSSEQYKTTYGIFPYQNGIELQFVTGGNVGSRLYLLKDNKYWFPELLNKQLSIDIDISELPCAINSAVYLVQMNSSSLDTLGIGYGDAQCPTDIKYFYDGKVNRHNSPICSTEIDIIEANREAMAWTLHPCNGNYCDKSGADANSYRQGYHDFYGPHKKVDTTKPFTVITQFIGDPVKEIKRLYKQNDILLEHPGGSLTSESIAKWKQLQNEPNVFEQTGGFESLTNAIKQGMGFVLSIWDDPATNMRWLDSNERGPCSGNDQPRNTNPNVKVRFSNIKLEPLNQSLLEPSQPNPISDQPNPISKQPSNNNCSNDVCNLLLNINCQINLIEDKSGFPVIEIIYKTKKYNLQLKNFLSLSI